MDTLLSAVANNQLGDAEKLPIAAPLRPRALYIRTRDPGPRRAHVLLHTKTQRADRPKDRWNTQPRVPRREGSAAAQGRHSWSLMWRVTQCGACSAILGHCWFLYAVNISMISCVLPSDAIRWYAGYLANHA